jgi:O-6-methylguanine DNA methyltransferase
MSRQLRLAGFTKVGDLTVGVDDLKGRLPQSKLCREGAQAVAAVKRYFEGEETDFSGFRLDLGEQDPFFERVYAAARHVGWGRTTTYGALAMELGARPEAARDVGQAMARNPVALIIPRHRVLAAGGRCCVRASSRAGSRHYAERH